MKKPSIQSGFTLVELLVSLALFTVVVVAAVGSLYTVNQASVKVNAMRTVLDNLNFATESMSRTIRTGENIVCGGVDNSYSRDISSGSPNCPFGNYNGAGKAISLYSAIEGQTIEYRWRQDSTGNNEIQKCTVVNNNVTDNDCVAITSPDINVEKMSFYVSGASPTDTVQPGVMIQIQGTANGANGDLSPFALQTFISQRSGETPVIQ